jgi:hypothetical protein
MKFFNFNLIYPIFDVESIGDGPRVPRAHLEVVFTSSPNEFRASPVRGSGQVESHAVTLVANPTRRPLIWLRRLTVTLRA